MASGKQEVIPAFLKMSIQVSSPAMPNVVASGCWLAGASRPVDYQARAHINGHRARRTTFIGTRPTGRHSLLGGSTGTQGSYGS